MDGGSTDKRRFRGTEEREKEMKIDAQCYVDRIRKELLQSTTRQKINLCASRMNVKLKQPPLLNRLFNMSNIVSNMGVMNKNAREEGYRVTVYDIKRFPALQ